MLRIMNRKQNFYGLNRHLTRIIANGCSYKACCEVLCEMEPLIHTDKMQAVHDDAIDAVASMFPEEFPNYVIVS